MKEQENEHFVIYMVVGAIVSVAVILAVWWNETEKFAPIKAQISSDNQQMNIRVIAEYGEKP